MSTVMTRQNRIPMEGGSGQLALIPAWDMSNHEQGIVCVTYLLFVFLMNLSSGHVIICWFRIFDMLASLMVLIVTFNLYRNYCNQYEIEKMLSVFSS